MIIVCTFSKFLTVRLVFPKKILKILPEIPESMSSILEKSCGNLKDAKH